MFKSSSLSASAYHTIPYENLAKHKKPAHKAYLFTHINPFVTTHIVVSTSTNNIKNTTTIATATTTTIATTNSNILLFRLVFGEES